MTKNPRSVRPAPLSIRLNAVERRILIERAGKVPVSTFVKSVLFSRAGSSRSMNGDALASILALLGKSQTAESLRRIAAYADNGLLADAETCCALQAACTDLADIRRLLLEALGKRSSASRAFASATNAGQRS